MSYADKIEMSVDLEATNCCICGIVFAVPTGWHRSRREKKDLFYCPSGHQLAYTGEQETDRLRKQVVARQAELDRMKADRDHERERAEAAKRQAAAARGQVTKIRKRLSAGLCPCCNRFFDKLQRHLQTQHPEFTGATND